MKSTLVQPYPHSGSAAKRFFSTLVRVLTLLYRNAFIWAVLIIASAIYAHYLNGSVTTAVADPRIGEASAIDFSIDEAQIFCLLSLLFLARFFWVIIKFYPGISDKVLSIPTKFEKWYLGNEYRE